jgi:hypothetical protein
MSYQPEPVIEPPDVSVTSANPESGVAVKVASNAREVTF